MKTLDLSEAAKLLHLHPSTVYAMARSGEIPAAKPGKCWVFIDEDLHAWIRSKYNQPRRIVISDKGGITSCSLKEKISGITNLPSVEKQYTDLLAPITKKKRKK